MFPNNNTLNRGYGTPSFQNQAPNIFSRPAGSNSMTFGKTNQSTSLTNDTNLFSRNVQTPNLYQGTNQQLTNNLLQPNQNILNAQNMGAQFPMNQMQNVNYK